MRDNLDNEQRKDLEMEDYKRRKEKRDNLNVDEKNIWEKMRKKRESYSW